MMKRWSEDVSSCIVVKSGSGCVGVGFCSHRAWLEQLLHELKQFLSLWCFVPSKCLNHLLLTFHKSCFSVICNVSFVLVKCPPASHLFLSHSCSHAFRRLTIETIQAPLADPSPVVCFWQSLPCHLGISDSRTWLCLKDYGVG